MTAVWQAVYCTIPVATPPTQSHGLVLLGIGKQYRYWLVISCLPRWCNKTQSLCKLCTPLPWQHDGGCTAALHGLCTGPQEWNKGASRDIPALSRGAILSWMSACTGHMIRSMPMQLQAKRKALRGAAASWHLEDTPPQKHNLTHDGSTCASHIYIMWCVSFQSFHSQTLCTRAHIIWCVPFHCMRPNLYEPAGI